LADPDDFVLLPNNTMGVSTVLRSLALGAGDEVVITNHGYFGTFKAVEAIAAKAGATVVMVTVPFPLDTPAQVTESVLAVVKKNQTKLVILDHITSPTALLFPIEEIAAALAKLNIDLLVDGAHGPGMVALDLKQLGAAYYTGTFYKWVGAPKGAAFLYVRPDRQAAIHPLARSYGSGGANAWQQEFGWTGTYDPTAFPCIPDAIKWTDDRGGWDARRAAHRKLALFARSTLAERLGVELPCPDDMVGSMAAILLPDRARCAPAPNLFEFYNGGDRDHGLHDRLLEADRIEVQRVWPWTWANPLADCTNYIVRVSAYAYNQREDYVRLADALHWLLSPA